MLNLMSRLAEDNLGSTVLWSQVRTVKGIYFLKQIPFPGRLGGDLPEDDAQPGPAGVLQETQAKGCEHSDKWPNRQVKRRLIDQNFE